MIDVSVWKFSRIKIRFRKGKFYLCKTNKIL